MNEITKKYPNLNANILGVVRDEKFIFLKKNDVMNVNDKAYVIINSLQLKETLEAFGHNEKISNKILIIGGGNIGFNLAKNLENSQDSIRINDDEDNLMVSVLVEKFSKDKRTMALINKPNYSILQSSLKIDDLIDPRMNTVSSILKHVHKGTIETAYSISNGDYEVIEAEIIDSSELIDKELKNSNLPENIRIGAILRKNDIIIPSSKFIFKKKRYSCFFSKKRSVTSCRELV